MAVLPVRYADTATLPLMQRKTLSTASELSMAEIVAADTSLRLGRRMIFRWFSTTTRVLVDDAYGISALDKRHLVPWRLSAAGVRMPCA